MRKIILLLSLMISLSACSISETSDDEKPKVLVSFYVLEAITEMIGQDLIEVENLLPISADPHSYELSSTDMILLSETPYLIIMGNDFEHWYDEAYPQVKPENANVLNVSLGIEALLWPSGAVDPHIWTSLENFQAISESIANYLIEIVPSGKDQIESNLKEVIARLNQIKTDTDPLFDRAQKNQFVSETPAFQYLANSLNLEMISITQPGHISEVDAKRLTDILSMMDQSELTVVFYQNPLDTKIVDTLALERDVETQLLSSLEQIDESLNLDIIDYLADNYENLALSLQ